MSTNLPLAPAAAILYQKKKKTLLHLYVGVSKVGVANEEHCCVIAMSATPRNLYVWGLTVFAAFGGFLFGYDIGQVSAETVRKLT